MKDALLELVEAAAKHAARLYGGPWREYLGLAWEGAQAGIARQKGRGYLYRCALNAARQVDRRKRRKVVQNRAGLMYDTPDPRLGPEDLVMLKEAGVCTESMRRSRS